MHVDGERCQVTICVRKSSNISPHVVGGGRRQVRSAIRVGISGDTLGRIRAPPGVGSVEGGGRGRGEGEGGGGGGGH